MKKMKLNIQLFAEGTFNVSTGNANISGYVQMTSASNGSSANSSEVIATLYLRRTNNYSGTPSQTSSFEAYFKIDGQEHSFSTTYRRTIPNDKSYVKMADWKTTVSHNADGSKVCSISVKTTSTNSSFSVPLTTGSLTLDTIPRYANVNNFSLKILSRTEIQVTWGADANCDAVQYSLNGGGWNNASGYPNFTISGLKSGTPYSVKIRVKRTDSQLWSAESTTLNATTKYDNELTKANNFNDEQNPYMEYSSKSSLPCNLRLEFAGKTINRNNITSGTSYTFNLTEDERKLLRQSATSNTLTVRYVVATLENSKEVAWSFDDRTMTIVNANPVFTDFVFEDINPNSVALTGNNQIFINKISKVKVTVPVANKMVALKEASPKRYEMTLDTTNSVAYSDTNEVYTEFNNVETNNISVTAYDSRNNKQPVNKTTTLLQYTEPTFSNIKIGRQNGVGTVVDLSVSGTYYNTDFGNALNTILNISYTKDNGENWIDITDKFVFADGNFSSIAGSVLPDFELGEEYEVIFMVTDGGVVNGTNYTLKSVSSAKQTINSGQPTLDVNKTKKGVGINCIAEDKGLWIDGHNLLDIIYPVGAIYMSVNNVNPSTLLGGKWEQLKNRFLVGAGDTYSNGATGGNESISYTPSGSVANHTLTTGQIPGHTHDRGTFNITGGIRTRPATNGSNLMDASYGAFGYTQDGGGASWWGGWEYKSMSSQLPTDLIYLDASAGWSGTSGYTGDGGGHNHGFTGTKATIDTMPPYLAVYMWKRIA